MRDDQGLGKVVTSSNQTRQVQGALQMYVGSKVAYYTAEAEDNRQGSLASPVILSLKWGKTRVSSKP